MLSVPPRVAAAVGANCSVTLQLAAAARFAPQVVDRKLKSVPETDAEDGTVTVTLPIPVLDRVTTAALVAPTCVLLNVGVETVALGT